MPAPGLNRRALLQWGALLTAGAVLPGCGGGGGPRDDLPEPQALRSVNGVLELHLNVGYASMDMDLPDSDIARWARYPADRQPGRRLELRSFNGRYTAPTLWLRPGDTLKMWVHNQLPASPRARTGRCSTTRTAPTCISTACTWTRARYGPACSATTWWTGRMPASRPAPRATTRSICPTTTVAASTGTTRICTAPPMPRSPAACSAPSSWPMRRTRSVPA